MDKRLIKFLSFFILNSQKRKAFRKKHKDIDLVERGAYIYQLWRGDGNFKGVVSCCDELCNMQNLKVDEKTSRFWLVYISSLISLRDERALTILNKYIKAIGLYDVHYYLLVAKLAHDNGHINDNITKASVIIKRIEEAEQENSFSQLIKGKTIAIVGNGPCELGRGKGQEIDAHDIIIRFNCAVTDGYENDYGSKMDIWSRGGGMPYDRFEHDKHLGMFWGFLFNRGALDLFFDDLYENITLYPDQIFFMPSHISKGFIEEENIVHPTSGFVMGYYILKLAVAKKVDLYGFSFLDVDKKENTPYTHYDDFTDEFKEATSYALQIHDWDREADCLRRLLAESKQDEVS